MTLVTSQAHAERLAAAYTPELIAAIQPHVGDVQRRGALDTIWAILGCGLGLDAESRTRILGAVGHTIREMRRAAGREVLAATDARVAYPDDNGEGEGYSLTNATLVLEALDTAERAAAEAYNVLMAQVEG